MCSCTENEKERKPWNNVRTTKTTTIKTTTKTETTTAITTKTETTTATTATTTKTKTATKAKTKTTKIKIKIAKAITARLTTVANTTNYSVIFGAVFLRQTAPLHILLQRFGIKNKNNTHLLTKKHFGAMIVLLCDIALPN